MRPVTLLYLLLLMTTPSAVAVGGVSRDEVRSAVRKVFEKGDYQTELPMVGPSTSNWSFLEWLADLLGTETVRQVLWLCLVLGAATVLALLVAWGVRRWSPVSRAVSTADQEAALEVSERPLGSAETFARRGEFGEAIHILLLCTIEEIRTQLHYDPPDSLTSREILSAAPLPSRARQSLGSLVHRVEEHYLGTRQPTRDDYDRCVENFRRARAALANGADA